MSARTVRAFLISLRPSQWTKNLLLFAGLIFSRHTADPSLVWRAAAGCLTFCLLSGAVYVWNDSVDAPRDRLHPQKRHRPIAAGELDAVAARRAAAALGAFAAAAAWLLGVGFGLIAAAFLLLNVLYSLVLKRLVIVDVIGIATGFVLRAVASVEVLRSVSPRLRLSPWLILCTFLLALFLGFAKRRAEFVHETPGSNDSRPSLRHYNDAGLNLLIGVSFVLTIAAYVLYTLSPATTAMFGTHKLVLTVPFVLGGMGRYLALVFRGRWGGRPHEILLTDAGIQTAVLGWIVTAWLVIGLHR